MLVVKGDGARAVRALEPALAVAREPDIVQMVLILTTMLGRARTLAGDVAEGLALQEPGHATAQEAGLGVMAAKRLTDLGWALVVSGRLDDARTHVDAALASARQRGQRADEAAARYWLGEIAARRSSSERPSITATRWRWRPSSACAPWSPTATPVSPSSSVVAGSRRRPRSTS